MKKSLLLLLIGHSLLFSGNSKTTSGDICLCPLAKNSLKIKMNYNRINDTIDILNIKEQELGKGNLGSMGDSSGYDLSLGYGITDFIALYYNYGYISIHYADTKIKNSQHDIYTKINLYHNPDNFFKTFSIDLGYIYNNADDLDIKKASTLNTMVKKIRPNTNLIFTDDGGVNYKDSIIYIIGDNGIIPPPFMRIADMSDKSFYIRALTNLNINKNIINLYFGIKSTSITSTIKLISNEKYINHPAFGESMSETLDKFSGLNLDRDEKTLFAGLNYAYQYQDYIFEAGYEYLKITGRESKLDATDDNHILNATVSRKVNDQLRVFIGAKAMLHQFNGVIPFLYNEYTKHRYDKKYGYAKIGFIYNVDFNSLTN